MEMDKDKKAWVVGLCVACPHGKELDECPLRQIRLKPLKERVRMIHDMTAEFIDRQLNHHAKCSAIRSLS